MMDKRELIDKIDRCLTGLPDRKKINRLTRYARYAGETYPDDKEVFRKVRFLADLFEDKIFHRSLTNFDHFFGEDHPRIRFDFVIHFKEENENSKGGDKG